MQRYAKEQQTSETLLSVNNRQNLRWHLLSNNWLDRRKMNVMNGYYGTEKREAVFAVY
jgi:hypothetical protein